MGWIAHVHELLNESVCTKYTQECIEQTVYHLGDAECLLLQRMQIFITVVFQVADCSVSKLWET